MSGSGGLQCWCAALCLAHGFLIYAQGLPPAGSGCKGQSDVGLHVVRRVHTVIQMSVFAANA